jgi:hypothetical protein
LIFVGTLMVLGWLGIALASAANASAAPGGHGQPVATGIDRVLTPLTKAVVGQHPASAQHGSGLFSTEASTVAKPHAKPAAKTHRPPQPAAPQRSVLPTADQLVTRVTTPITTAVLARSGESAPAAGAPSVPAHSASPTVGQTLGQDLQAVTTIVRQTANLSVQVPVLGLTIHLGTTPATLPAPVAAPPVGRPVALTFAAATPNKPARPAARATSKDTVDSVAATHDSRSPGQPAPVHPRSTNVSSDRFVDGGPAPAPATPPALPGVALAGASGTASAGNKPGSGTGTYSARAGETWAAQHLQLLCRSEWNSSRDVRDSATKPPVAPD